MGVEKIISIDSMSSAQKSKVELNIIKFDSLMQKAYNGKLTSNKDVCGFSLLAPINNRDFTLVLFHGTPVANVYPNNKIEILTFNKVVWGEYKFKYDVLRDISEKIIGKEDLPVFDVVLDGSDVTGISIVKDSETPAIVVKPKAKRKPRKKTTKKK